MTTMTRRMLGAAAVGLLFAASFAAAQAPQMVRVRATIENVDVPMLTVKSRDGAEMKIKLADNKKSQQPRQLGAFERLTVDVDRRIGGTHDAFPNRSQLIVAIDKEGFHCSLVVMPAKAGIQ